MQPNNAAVLSGSSMVSTTAHTGRVVHGVAIGEGDETDGLSNTRLHWPRAALQQAADALAGAPITRDHPGVERTADGLSVDPQPPIDSVVGTVTDTRYESGVGLLFEAEIHDDEVYERITAGLADVSPVLQTGAQPSSPRRQRHLLPVQPDPTVDPVRVSSC